MQPKLICILGAECTGKTTLARALAWHFHCPWVPEYLRVFCDLNQRTPTQAEQRTILENQHQAELTAQARAVQQATPFVFCDTAPLLSAIYSDYIFADPSLYHRARALHSHYTLTLLLENDIAWQADGLQRDGAHVRAPVTALIRDELRALGAPWHSITGHGERRLEAALAAIATRAPSPDDC